MGGVEDILYPFLKIYNSLPLSVRNIIGKVYRLLPNSLRYGRFYSAYYKRISIFQNSNNGVSLSQNLLQNQVNYAIKNIPFYKQFEYIKSIEELKKIPVVDKETITRNPALFINSELKSRGLKSNTGGSSGTPFSFLIEKGITRSKEAAHFGWYWNQYGFNSGDKVLMIRGKSLQNNGNYEYQVIGNKLVVSCYNLNQSSLKEIYTEILKFKPKFIHAYPSSLLIFTKELQVYLKNDSPDFRVDAIFLGSEYLFEHDEKLFNSFYKSNIITWYGHSECLIHGGKCNLSGDYHFYPFYGFLELIDKNGLVINEPNVEGRIVATGFDNNVMPLIRYDTGDLGVYSEKNVCECGFRGKSLSKIVGRGKDFIVLDDYTKVTLTAFIFGQHHVEFEKIKEIQIIQNVKGIIDLHLVPLNDFKVDDIINLKSRLENSVKKNMLCVNIRLVELIEKTHRGKHKILIQNISF